MLWAMTILALAMTSIRGFSFFGEDMGDEDINGEAALFCSRSKSSSRDGARPFIFNQGKQIVLVCGRLRNLVFILCL